ncbi:MAG: rolling circle replication-associated protein [Minisyncoccota bacterium]
MSYSKVIQSGNHIELFEYEHSLPEKRPRMSFKQRKRETLDIDQSLQKRLDNIIRARRNFFRLVQANLKSAEKPVFITLTTIKEKSLVSAYKYLTQFITRLRKIYGSEFRYIAVPEYQKRGAVHFHCLVWGLPVSDVFDEIPWIVRKRQTQKILTYFLTFCHEYKLESTTARGTRYIQHQWMRGFLDCLPTDGSPKLATYMAKYMSKAMSDRRLYQSKSYVCGRNSLRPLSKGFTPFDGDLELFIGNAVQVRMSEYHTYLGQCKYTVYDDSQQSITNPLIQPENGN